MSTFFGLSIASSGLKAYNAAANTTANNISNVNTEGYSRQQTNISANSALRSYTDWGTLSTGVSADSITQIRSEYYDNKFWQYSGYRGEYDEKVEYMDQLQTFFQDDSTVRGFSTVYATLFNDIDYLSDNAEDTTVRNQVISDAKNLCSYFNSVASSLSAVQQGINEQVKTTVDSLNSTAQKIALLNDQINSIEITGAYANDLRDQRAALIDKLSTMASVSVKETKVENSNFPDMYTGATNFVVKINDMELVNGADYRQLECVAREHRVNQGDADGLYDIRWTDTKASFSATASNAQGSLKGLMELRDGNNKEFFSGKVSKIQGRMLTIEMPSITNEDSITMPSEGTIKVGDKEYTYGPYQTYPGWTMNKDVNGKVTFTFCIQGQTSGLASAEGKPVNIGQSIDYKGIPYYQSQMNEFIRALTRQFNYIQKSGVDLEGNQMGAFFVAENKYGTELTFGDDAGANPFVETRRVSSEGDNYYQLTAANIKIAQRSLDDPRYFATSTKEMQDQGIASYDIVTKLQALQKDTVLYRGGNGEMFLQYLISDVTVDAEEARLLDNNYQTIQATVDNQRQSVSGVDEDEEALDLVKFQNAYNLCSKVIQVMSEMYDRLITQTGV